MRWQVSAGFSLATVSLLMGAPQCFLVWLVGVALIGYGLGRGRPLPPREG